MNDFTEMQNKFFSDFGDGRKMVLSTSDNGKVSSRMMSVVQIEGKFYFQTDFKMKKCGQIKHNNNVALCIDNIQIEGTCEEIGHPLDNSRFCEVFKKCYEGSFKAYTSLDSERLFVVRPTYVERWIYKDTEPFIEIMDIQNEQYSLEKYKG